MGLYRPLFAAVALAAALGAAAPLWAQSVLIRGATVHTATRGGTLRDTDVLVQNGRIAAIGTNLAAPPTVRRIDARGKPLTPGLFGGLSHVGVFEIGLEPTAADVSAALGMRPEFDLALAFNPQSVTVTNTRIDGVTFTMLAPSAATGRSGGALLTGQGALVRLDGGVGPIGDAARALFVEIGGDAVALAGGSRAAQYMLLQQALIEARTPTAL
ncbi:MAG: amidohydrolase, partial [Gammaproteobacteria bacterium]|nr:amidohydrolase [Gammaproteobacteria bacterium]